MLPVCTLKMRTVEQHDNEVMSHNGGKATQDPRLAQNTEEDTASNPQYLSAVCKAHPVAHRLLTYLTRSVSATHPCDKTAWRGEVYLVHSFRGGLDQAAHYTAAREQRQKLCTSQISPSHSTMHSPAQCRRGHPHSGQVSPP